MHGSSATDNWFRAVQSSLNCGESENNPLQAQILVPTASANNTSQPTTSTFHSLVILHPH